MLDRRGTGDMIICGDCLQEMKNLQDESVDLVVTSPPYAMQRKDKLPITSRDPVQIPKLGLHFAHWDTCT